MVIQALKLVTEPANMVVYIGIFWGYDGDNNPDEFIIEKHSFNRDLHVFEAYDMGCKKRGMEFFWLNYPLVN